MISTNCHYGRRLRILHWCTDQLMTDALAQMDLTAAQGHIMGFLSRQTQPPCARDVEEALHLSHPTVSGLLNRLEKKGFVELRPDEQDHRCKRIYTLPKGHECRTLMHNTMEQIEERLVLDFTPEEREEFSSLLDRAIQNMGGRICRHPNKEESKE